MTEGMTAAEILAPASAGLDELLQERPAQLFDQRLKSVEEKLDQLLGERSKPIGRAKLYMDIKQQLVVPVEMIRELEGHPPLTRTGQ